MSAIDAPAELQDNTQLEALARSEASLHLPALTPHERFVAGPISTNVRLGRCSQPVKPSVSPGGQMRDRILVELSCPARNHLSQGQGSRVLEMCSADHHNMGKGL